MTIRPARLMWASPISPSSSGSRPSLASTRGAPLVTAGMAGSPEISSSTATSIMPATTEISAFRCTMAGLLLAYRLAPAARPRAAAGMSPTANGITWLSRAVCPVRWRSSWMAPPMDRVPELAATPAIETAGRRATPMIRTWYWGPKNSTMVRHIQASTAGWMKCVSRTCCATLALLRRRLLPSLPMPIRLVSTTSTRARKGHVRARSLTRHP